MNQRYGLPVGLLTACAFGILILDSATAFQGAAAGIELCLKTVIPSLFPFLILTFLFTGTPGVKRNSLLKPLSHLCRLPDRAETLFLAGLLGGYPTGAQAIAHACATGRLDSRDGRRMLGFCSNVGPAFLFGMVSRLFSSRRIAFVLWGIHIISAVITGALLPGGQDTASMLPSARQKMPVMRASLQAMANICGWVILFRVIIQFLQRWLLWVFPLSGQIFITGMLELTNGITALFSLQEESMRFLMASVFLGFGGLCVAMQTHTIASAAGLDCFFYFPGKFMQAGISAVFSILSAPFLFPNGATLLPLVFPAGVTFGTLLVFLRKREKYSSISAPVRV